MPSLLRRKNIVKHTLTFWILCEEPSYQIGRGDILRWLVQEDGEPVAAGPGVSVQVNSSFKNLESTPDPVVDSAIESSAVAVIG
jgi:hypothetical protein